MQDFNLDSDSHPDRPPAVGSLTTEAIDGIDPEEGERILKIVDFNEFSKMVTRVIDSGDNKSLEALVPLTARCAERFGEIRKQDMCPAAQEDMQDVREHLNPHPKGPTGLSSVHRVAMCSVTQKLKVVKPVFQRMRKEKGDLAFNTLQSLEYLKTIQLLVSAIPTVGTATGGGAILPSCSRFGH
ncbi:hypothetical protein Salat_0511400 [Sesamum alatum]|uniref:Uncharacterized protein n=1 Tax=Sesamum alatum TaxID=300844 RepID=A0AAE1Z3Y8_9LAMI|nr:hypothetical protein Salat_0511400 [Sesamum alatum]